MTSLRSLFRDGSWLRILSEAPRLPCRERGPAGHLAQGCPRVPRDPLASPAPSRCASGDSHVHKAPSLALRPQPGRGLCGGGTLWHQHPGHPALPVAAVPGCLARRGAPAAHSSRSLSFLFILSNKGSGKGTWKEFSSFSGGRSAHQRPRSAFCSRESNAAHLVCQAQPELPAVEGSLGGNSVSVYPIPNHGGIWTQRQMQERCQQP